MKRKTLTTSFLDFSGGAEGSFMGTVLIREVAIYGRLQPPASDIHIREL